MAHKIVPNTLRSVRHIDALNSNQYEHAVMGSSDRTRSLVAHQFSQVWAFGL